MARLMTFFVGLLLSLSAGFGTYAIGAIVWSTIDPDEVGAKLLFTIPIALAGMTIPGIIGLLCYTFRADFISEPRRATRSSARPAPALAPRRPARTLRPAMVDPVADEDIELALAT
jgi:hypothetical protein